VSRNQAHQSAFSVSQRSIRRWLGVLAMFVAIFLIWEFTVKLLGIKEYLLPPPSKIWSEFNKRQSTVMSGAWITSVEIIGGYLLAVAVSIPLAMAIAYSRFVENTIYPVIVFLQIIPKIAIAPLFIIWLGFGLMPKLLIVFLLCFFPIVEQFSLMQQTPVSHNVCHFPGQLAL
jgi:NitT/TauT family transport system permease protein